MGGGDKNFKDLMLSGQVISKTKVGVLVFFLIRFIYFGGVPSGPFENIEIL